MTTDQERLEFLKRPENVALAYEIVSLFPKVVSELTKKFWTELFSQLEPAIAAKAAGWHALRFPPTLANGFGIVVRPVQFREVQTPDDDDRRMFVQIALQQEKPLEGLFCGLSFNRNITAPEKSRVSQMLKPLQEQLARLQYSRKGGDWGLTYITWKYIEPKGSSRSELLRAVATDGSAEREVAEEVVGCFSEMRQGGSLNGELASIRENG
jgi:hypothetical protein